MAVISAVFAAYVAVVFSTGAPQAKGVLAMDDQMTPEEIRALSDDELIALAAGKLKMNFSGFDAVNFDIIKVNRKPGTGGVWVSFSVSVRYVPLESTSFYAIGTDVIEGMSSAQGEANPEGYKGEGAGGRRGFFAPTEESKKAVDFVLAAVDGDEETGPLLPGLKLPPDTTMVIRDASGHYEVSVTSPGIESWYNVDKETGALTGGGHAHLDYDDEAGEGDLDEEVE